MIARQRAAAHDAAGHLRDVARLYSRHLVLFSLVAGLFCGGWAPWLAVPVAIAGVVLAGRPVVAGLVVVAVLGGAAFAGARKDAIDVGTLPAAYGAQLHARAMLLEPLHERAAGELVGRGRIRGEQILLKVPDRSRLGPAAGPDAAGGADGAVGASGAGGATPMPAPGDVLAVDGRVEEMDEFDEIQRRRGAIAAVIVDSAKPTGDRRGGVLGVLDGVRRRAERGLSEGVPREDAALMQGMVLGRDDTIGADTKSAFQASGLAHLLAVSGTNVLLLSTLALALGALVGVPLRTRLFLALGLVALYVPLTGAGASIQRAGVMGAAGLVAALAGRPASRLYALGLAAAVTLAINPYAAGDAGWQLSFAAVVGLMALAPAIHARLSERRLPAPVAEAGAMTIAATIATAPLLAVHFGQVSLASLPANLLAAPVVAPIMWLGMIGAAVAQISPALAAPFATVTAPLVGFVDAVAHAAAGVPHGVLAIHLPGLLGAVAGYAVLAVAWRFPRVGATAAGAALVLSLIPKPAITLAAGETVVSFLDIGQGDATLIQRDGHAVLFDTGPPGGPILIRLRAAGVTRLDALVTTHAQADHEGMAIPIVDHFRPRLIVDGGRGWNTPVQHAYPAAAQRVGARLTNAAAGDVLHLGPLTVRFLSPTAEAERAPPIGDPNNRALVARLSSGNFDLLLTADAESDVTGSLDLQPIEALKVAHHGSEDAGLPAELEQLQPIVAGIEVGRHNTYGHPTPETLKDLEVVPHVYRTDQDGTVQLHVLDGHMWVVSHAT